MQRAQNSRELLKTRPPARTTRQVFNRLVWKGDAKTAKLEALYLPGHASACPTQRKTLPFHEQVCTLFVRSALGA
jgi:hypothetical protein